MLPPGLQWQAGYSSNLKSRKQIFKASPLPQPITVNVIWFCNSWVTKNALFLKGQVLCFPVHYIFLLFWLRLQCSAAQGMGTAPLRSCCQCDPWPHLSMLIEKIDHDLVIADFQITPLIHPILLEHSSGWHDGGHLGVETHLLALLCIV